MDEESFESAHNHDSETRGLGGAVSIDVVENARQYFEASEENPVNLEDVLHGMLDFSHELTVPPDDFDIKQFLEKFANDPEDDSYSQALKFAANYGIAHLDLFELLSGILWCRIATLFKDYLSENLDELHVTNKEFTWATARVHQMFLTQEYRSDIITAFGVQKWIEIDDGQRGMGACLLLHLYQLFVSKLGKLIHDHDREAAEADRFDVYEMGAEGRGKIRYVGGWAMKKCLDKFRRYVVENKFSESPDVRLKLNIEMRKIDLLENHAIVPHEILQRSSNNPETLDVIESRQYRGRGLLHISDNAYVFFLSLEQERLNQINNSKLLSLKNDLVDNAMMHVLKNVDLERKFTAIFGSSDGVDKVRTDKFRSRTRTSKTT